MKVPLSKEALGKLPRPDAQGVVRGTAAMTILADGTGVDLTELNDMPVGGKPDDDEPMPPGEMDERLDAAERDIYG